MNRFQTSYTPGRLRFEPEPKPDNTVLCAMVGAIFALIISVLTARDGESFFGMWLFLTLVFGLLIHALIEARGSSS